VRLRQLVVVGCAMAGLLLEAGVAAGPSALAATPTLKQRLANVVVPAYCRMPRQRLHNGKTAAKYLPASGSIFFGPPSKGGAMLVHLRSTGTQVLAQYGCNAGNVSWPAVIVAYDRHNRLIDDIKLGDISQTEHADIRTWHADGRIVRITWISYEGCCFHVKTHHSTLTLSGGRLHLT
jgi:hypothetical protein